jgi:hypothetical protein
VRKVGTLAEPDSGETAGGSEAPVVADPLPAASAGEGGMMSTPVEAEVAGGAGTGLIEPGGDRGTVPERGGWRSAARQAPGLAALAALGVLGTVGFAAAWALDGGSTTPTTAVSSSARNLVLALTNFDPGTVGADFAQIQSDATGTFASQAKTFFGASIRKELTTANAASRGTIDDLYVQSVSGSHATVFAVVSQRYLNKDASAPVNDTLRLVLGMTDVNGTWKTSSVQVLQQPVGSTTGGASSVTTPKSKSKSKSHSH